MKTQTISAKDINTIAENNGFQLIYGEGEAIEEICGNVWLFKHKHSRARLLFLENNDNNKAFSIAFRTPPANSTGVFHILEHSVLCGSEKFPLKEPFVNLLKSSMQTFLNAMTFPDKTVYPVASTNEQDLMNLMEVYLDAVFNPKIYSNKDIFLQEGWHKIVEGENREGTSGVVYNEMKGALSDPESVLFDTLCSRLYPKTCYEFESGGEPSEIVNLTYEEFIKTHACHYSPENSYICLYGNIKLDALSEFLRVINENYLEPATKKKNKTNSDFSPNKLQIKSKAQPEIFDVRMKIKPENAVYAKAFKIGTYKNLADLQMISILMDVLLSSNVSSLKKRLLKTKVANEFYSFVIEPVAEPAVVIACQGVMDERALEITEEVISGQMQEIVEGKFDKKQIEAQIDNAEFRMREHDFGTADGVIYSLACLSTWLYDDKDPISALKFEMIFKDLRKMLENGKLETLVKRVFLDNPQVAGVRVLPETATVVKSKACKILSEEEASAIRASENRLKQNQSAPDSPEDIKKLPQLSLSDIDKKMIKHEVLIENDGRGNLTKIKHKGLDTHGINYFNVFLDFCDIEIKDLPYLSLLTSFLGKFDTEQFSAEQIDFEKKKRCGSFSIVPAVSTDVRTNLPRLMIKIATSCLEGKDKSVSELAESILNETKFDNEQRIMQILMQQKLALDQSLVNEGHLFAMKRASSKIDASSFVSELMTGISYKQFLDKISENLDDNLPLIMKKINALYEKLKTPRPVVYSYCAGDKVAEEWMEGTIGRATSGEFVSSKVLKIELSENERCKREAFAVKSDVTFSAIRNNLNRLNNIGDKSLLRGLYAFGGAWPVASRALSFDYLWNTIRVQGGAYGCGFSASHVGDCGFYTYRDPNIESSIETFSKASEWLYSFMPDEREMQGYVISTLAGLDHPLKPREIIARSETQFFAELSEDDRANIREAVLKTSAKDVNELSEQVKEIASESPICVVGCADVIKNSKMFDQIIEL